MKANVKKIIVVSSVALLLSGNVALFLCVD